MVGGVAGLSLEDDWDLPFQDSIRAGRVLLAVHAAEKDDVEKAAKILEGKQPDHLDWLDAEGKKIGDGGESTTGDT